MANVGDKVYIYTRHGYMPGEIVKITPSGLIDVKTTHGSQAVYRFNKNGKKLGDDYNAWSIDTMPFDARTAYIKKANALRDALHAIMAIKEARFDSWGFGGGIPEKQQIATELEKIEAQVQKARELLNKCE
jgi:hypothetical protein